MDIVASSVREVFLGAYLYSTRLVIRRTCTVGLPYSSRSVRTGLDFPAFEIIQDLVTVEVLVQISI